MVNYYLYACLDFKLLLLAPHQKLKNLASSFAPLHAQILTGEDRCT